MCPPLGVTEIETGPTVTILNNVLTVLIYLTSILLTLTILMHKGQGGGLSDMFGGGISSSAGSSGVAERNLNRITLGTLLVWVICIICYALLVKFAS
jgi:preprotein translocase, secG subunit